MRCLVTGAAGFIGSHLAERLLEDHHEVVGLDCLTPYYATALKERNLMPLRDHRAFHLIRANLATADLAPLVADFDWVFHLAGQPGVRASWGASFAEYTDHNITATQRLLEALCVTPPQRIVYASSSSVYGNLPLPLAEDAVPRPLSPYGITKLAAEQLMLAYGASYGLPVTALRFFTVYGPRQRPDMALCRFIEAIARDEPLHLYGDGTQTRDITFVADVAAACLAATTGGAGQALNVGGGDRVSINDLIAYVGELLGHTPRILREPSQRGDAGHTEADTTRSRAALKWQPAVDWRAGVRRQVEWYIEQTASPGRRGATGMSARHATPRVVIYGHDTFGLGHLRRNLTIAAELSRTRPDVSIMLLTGSPMAQEYTLPDRVDYVKLPSVRKVANEDYQAQSVRMTSVEVVQMRAALIHETISSFAPDVVLVDHAPAGMRGEILPALRELRASRPQAKVALGLRDIIDEPERVRQQWADDQIPALLRDLYDVLFVYGTPAILNVAEAYHLSPELTAKLRYCGYLPRERPSGDVAALRRRLCPRGERLVVVTGGGGGDGFPLLHAYLSGLRDASYPETIASAVITGPFMSQTEQDALRHLAGPGVDIITFTPEATTYLAAADLVVSMGGYNTLCEILSLGACSLIVPRVEPRREQAIRAEAFARLGLIATLDPRQMTPALLTRQVATLLDDAAGARHQAEALRAFTAAGSLDGVHETIAALTDLIDQAVAPSQFAVPAPTK